MVSVTKTNNTLVINLRKIKRERVGTTVKPKSFGLRIAGQMWRRKRKLLTAEYFDWDSGPNLAMTVCCRLLKISRSGLVINQDSEEYRANINKPDNTQT